MAKFIAIHRQHGGCDYTIGCGISVDVIDADTLEAAHQQIIDEYANCEDCGDEIAGSVNSVELHRLAEGSRLINNHEWLRVREEHKRIRDQERTEKKEREDFERLRGKYGG